jgi:hypothetical protein
MVNGIHPLINGATKVHHLAAGALEKSMKPKDLWKNMNYNKTQQYVWKGTAVKPEQVNKQSREERSLFGSESGGSFNGVTDRWFDGLWFLGVSFHLCRSSVVGMGK